MTPSSYWLLSAPLAPMLMALVLMIFPGARRSALVLAPWAAVPALLIALLPWNFATQRLPGMLLGTHIGLDETGRSFLLLSALVWWAGGLYAGKAYARQESPGFFVFFLLAMAGNLGVMIAGGILSYYFSFALMSFAAYGLVIHDRSPEVLRSGRIYMVFVLLGEVLLLSALMLAASGAQSYDFETIRSAVAASDQRNTVVLLAIMGLGIKIGLPGLHFTLPLIYRAAPLPAAAAMAGAMINAGLLGWLRLLPLGHVALLEWGSALMTVGMLAAFYGASVGLTQRDAKTLLSYSSISQMGILTAAVGLGLSSPHAWPQILMVITLYAVHHGLAKAALFLGLGMAQHCPDTRHGRWLACAGLLLPALALAGAPLTSGMLAKGFLKAEMTLAPTPWPELLGWLLPLSSLVTTLLAARFLYLAWPRHTRVDTCLAPEAFSAWIVLQAASLLLVWFLPRPVGLEIGAYSLWLHSLWPVLAGALIAAIIARAMLQRNIRVPEIPAGDLLLLLESAAKDLAKALAWLTEKQLPLWQEWILIFGAKRLPRPGWCKQLATLEAGLTSWPVAVILFVLLVLMAVLSQFVVSRPA